MLRALIAADYGKNTGTGHLTRCGSLARELTDAFEVTFVCGSNESLPFISEFAAGLGCGAVMLPDLRRAETLGRADLVIVDSYKATAGLLSEIRRKHNVCAVIDDNAALSFYDADYVINQNIGSEKLEYAARKDTRLLLGLNYLMLREAFLDKQPIDIAAKAESVVITMGGADVKGTTEKILKIVGNRSGYAFHVVVGPDFKDDNVAALEVYERQADNVRLHRNADMPELFSRCQGAVSACGCTVYELASMGVPTIGVVTAENQLKASSNMENEGIMLSAGSCGELSEQRFNKLFETAMEDGALRRRMHQKQISVIPRDGARRIKEELLKRF